MLVVTMNDMDRFRDTNWLPEGEARAILKVIEPIPAQLHRHILSLRKFEGAQNHDLFRDMVTAHDSLRRLCISLHFDAGEFRLAFELETYEPREESD